MLHSQCWSNIRLNMDKTRVINRDFLCCLCVCVCVRYALPFKSFSTSSFFAQLGFISVHFYRKNERKSSSMWKIVQSACKRMYVSVTEWAKKQMLKILFNSQRQPISITVIYCCCYRFQWHRIEIYLQRNVSHSHANVLKAKLSNVEMKQVFLFWFCICCWWWWWWWWWSCCYARSTMPSLKCWYRYGITRVLVTCMSNDFHSSSSCNLFVGATVRFRLVVSVSIQYACHLALLPWICVFWFCFAVRRPFCC